MQSCSIHPLPYHADPGPRFERVRHAPGAVLLDAGRPAAERGRFDLFSAWPQRLLSPTAEETGKAFFGRLRQALAELGEARLPADTPLPFAGGLIGYLSYDFARRLEQLPNRARDDLGLADAFAAALAKSKKAELVTADTEFKPLEKEIKINWLK